MKHTKISVIVPAYNASATLKKCISSILNSSYCELELILINDGSADNSLKIMREFERIDNRIKVINQRNKGLIASRIIGIRQATGEYITFCDADDYIQSDMLAKLLHLIENSGADIACCNHSVVSNKFAIKLRHKVALQNKTYDDITILYTGFFGSGIINSSVWGKLYKRVLFDNVLDELRKLPHIFWGEDTMINLLLFHEAQKVAVTNEMLYFYRYGGGSKVLNGKWISELQELYLWRNGFLKKANLSYLHKDNLAQVLNAFLYYYSKTREIEKIEIKTNLSYVIDDIDNYYTDYIYADYFRNIDDYSSAQLKSVIKDPVNVKIKQKLLEIF